MTYNGSISYASQDPWTLPDTIRENVVFGSPFDGSRLKEIYKLCRLDTDLSRMKLGDQTVILPQGPQSWWCFISTESYAWSIGGNISGGQRQRISLARALYANREILLLDDVLSAVPDHGSFLLKTWARSRSRFIV